MLVAHGRKLRIDRPPALARRKCAATRSKHNWLRDGPPRQGAGHRSESIWATSLPGAETPSALPRYNSAADIPAVYQHADTGRTCRGGTYGRSAYHCATGCSPCNACDAHWSAGCPTLACALSTDSERPLLGDQVADPRVPNAKTAAAKNARLTLIVFIPTSSADQPTKAIGGQLD